MPGTTPTPRMAAMVVVLLLLHRAHRVAGAAVGEGSCERICGSMTLAYPFGFSSGCTIVDDDHVAWLGDARELGLLVRNVTRSGIILKLALNCSRPFNSSVAALFSDNYAPGNTLIVGSCSPAPSITNCSSDPPERYLNRSSSHCSADESIRCMLPAPGPSYSSGRRSVNRSEVLASQCTGLVSSESYVNEPVPAEELGALGLDWWVQGQCHCSPSANCSQFTAPTTRQAAFRCECIEGFEGDGFIDGAGCQRPVVSSWREGCKIQMLTGAAASCGTFLLCVVCFFLHRRERRNTAKTARTPPKGARLFHGELVDSELEQGAAGPRRFSYHELAAAIDNFSDDRALGRGGFGSVYRGFLSDMNREVAVKRVSETSFFFEYPQELCAFYILR